MDYTRLQDLLIEGNWLEAAKEHYAVMREVAKRTKDCFSHYLDDFDLDKFPCEDIRTLDYLWVKYSNRHFGFSVQKRIYQDLAGTIEYSDETWKAFGDTVGWRKKGIWLCYPSLVFDKTAKQGHLPTTFLERYYFHRKEFHTSAMIFSRIKTCRL
jgi:hypothetical protein